MCDILAFALGFVDFFSYSKSTPHFVMHLSLQLTTHDLGLEDAFAFLLSTRAGGQGINLHGAVIFISDFWHFPAVLLLLKLNANM